MARLGGDLQVSPQELMTDSSIQMATLGTRATTGDGREFRYVKCGATALVPGKLYQQSATNTAWQDIDVAAASKGDKTIVTTDTITATVNQFAGGYVAITDGTGAGYYYKITGNTAATGAVCTIYLEEGLQTTLVAGTSDIDIIVSPFAEVVIWDRTNHSGVPLGVAAYPVTAEYYGWLQVKGPSNCLIDEGGILIGEEVYCSDDTDGAVGLLEDTAGAYPQIGTALNAASSSEYGLVQLDIS